MGAQKVKGKFIAANLGQGGADLKFADVVIANADLKALRGTPKTLVPAPGNGKVLEFLSAVLVLAAGSNALTESTANLAEVSERGRRTALADHRDDWLYRSGRASDHVRTPEARSHHGANRL